MGLFGIGELLLTTEEGLRFDGIKARVRLGEIGRTLLEMPRYWFTLARSTLIGIWMGITPAGPTAASFMSYGVARRSARDKSKFGKGTLAASWHRKPLTILPAHPRFFPCWRLVCRARLPQP